MALTCTIDNYRIWHKKVVTLNRSNRGEGVERLCDDAADVRARQRYARNVPRNFPRMNAMNRCARQARMRPSGIFTCILARSHWCPQLITTSVNCFVDLPPL
jgi:hypothetical protein